MLNLKGKSIILCLIFISGCFFILSCAGAEQKASELYETAVFEEKQFNKEHAIKLYEDIVNKYPDTETAKKARKALKRLRGKENIL